MARFSLTNRGGDMTQGPILRQLIAFSIPLLIGNLFQQFYNTVDSVIVGNFVSTQALAAVGSTNHIINTLIGFFLGLSTGAGVVISQYFGAHDNENVSKAVHTTVMMTILASVAVTGLGILITPAMLRFMSTPADVLPEATVYLRIYFAGSVGLLFYNMGSGILRAVGDSKRPLYFLCISSGINVVLDLVFVLVFHLGVAGVALATVASQVISACLIFLTLARTDAAYRFMPSKVRMHGKLMSRIIRVGMPAGIQQAITSFSNAFVQGYINVFGSAAMAGWSAYGRIDQIVMLPMQSLALASTTFMGQNVGARQLDRAKKGVSQSLYISLAATVVLTALLNLLCLPVLRIFTQDTAVIEFGARFIRLMSPLYVLSCFNQIHAGALRGAGDSKTPMIIMLCSFVVFRQIYLFAMSRLFPGNLTLVVMGYPAGWLMCSLWLALCYHFGHWEARCRKEFGEVQEGENKPAAAV